MNQQSEELRRITSIDGEHSADGNGTGGNVIDPNNPVLQPPKDTGANKNKAWKRKLIRWSVILLLVGAGIGALYLLLRVKRVNVTVNADSRKNAQSTKPQTEVTNSDSALTAEAINMARTAAGVDANTQPVNSASPVPSPSPSPGPTQESKVDFTGNSPVFEQIGKSGEGDANSNSQTNAGAAQAKTNASVVEPQSHANPTQSLFVDDAVHKSTPAPVLTQTGRESRSPMLAKVKPPTPTVPPFGTMLPVRTQGVIFTLRNDSYTRLELTRDMAGKGWSLPKGTVLIGRTTGGEHDRAFVNVIGYIDPRENKLVTMAGDVLGSDGANGIPGKRMSVDRSNLKQTLRKVASGGLQVASSMAGALTGRGTVVIDGAGYRLLDPINDQARGLAAGSEKNFFVKVEAGQQAYVMVVDLPGRVEGADAPGTEQLPPFSGIPENSLTDREVMELILFGTADDVRAAMPLMTEEQKRLALTTQSQENKRP
jgi:cytoskeletal protein RodZ